MVGRRFPIPSLKNLHETSNCGLDRMWLQGVRVFDWQQVSLSESDTHRDEHVAVAIDCLGSWLGQHRLPTASSGYEGLHCWASGLGEVVAFGIEGTGSYGAGTVKMPCQPWQDRHQGKLARQVHAPRAG